MMIGCVRVCMAFLFLLRHSLALEVEFGRPILSRSSNDIPRDDSQVCSMEDYMIRGQTPRCIDRCHRKGPDE